MATGSVQEPTPMEVDEGEDQSTTSSDSTQDTKTIEEMLQQLRNSADPVSRTLMITTEIRLRRVRLEQFPTSEYETSEGNTQKRDNLCPPSISETMSWSPSIAREVAAQQRFCDRVRPRGRGVGRGRGRLGRRLVVFQA